MITLIFFSLLWGAACLYLASVKNRKKVNWFFLGVLFGPIALVIILFMKKLN